MSKKFDICIEETVTYYLRVEAEDEDIANEIAETLELKDYDYEEANIERFVSQIKEIK